MGVGAHPELSGSGNTGNASQGGPVPPMGGKGTNLGKQKNKSVTATPQGWDEMGKCAGPAASAGLAVGGTKTPKVVIGVPGGKPVNLGSGLTSEGP